MNVKDKDFAGLQRGEPELTAIVSKSAVMGFIPSFDRFGIDHFAIGWRTRLCIHYDQLVCAIAQSFDTERPDINELFLALDASHVWRGAGFIAFRRMGNE